MTVTNKITSIAHKVSTIGAAADKMAYLRINLAKNTTEISKDAQIISNCA